MSSKKTSLAAREKEVVVVPEAIKLTEDEKELVSMALISMVKVPIIDDNRVATLMGKTKAEVTAIRRPLLRRLIQHGRDKSLVKSSNLRETPDADIAKSTGSSLGKRCRAITPEEEEGSESSVSSTLSPAFVLEGGEWTFRPIPIPLDWNKAMARGPVQTSPDGSAKKHVKAAFPKATKNSKDTKVKIQAGVKSQGKKSKYDDSRVMKAKLKEAHRRKVAGFR